jgi:hypothetical protein
MWKRPTHHSSKPKPKPPPPPVEDESAKPSLEVLAAEMRAEEAYTAVYVCELAEELGVDVDEAAQIAADTCKPGQVFSERVFELLVYGGE